MQITSHSLKPLIRNLDRAENGNGSYTVGFIFDLKV